ncbi:MAG: hypothetical protein ACXVLM_18020 [Ilumatobacteraceae bacterium]
MKCDVPTRLKLRPRRRLVGAIGGASLCFVAAVSISACSPDPPLLAWCPPPPARPAAPPPDPIGSEAHINTGTALDQLVMTNPNVYLGVWWDAESNTFVVAAADGRDHQDVVKRFQPELVRVVRAPFSRSFFDPNLAALQDPTSPASGLWTSAGVDPMSAKFRVSLNDVSPSSRKRVTSALPVHEDVCIEPEPQVPTAP